MPNIYDLVDTWDNGALVWNAIKMNVSDAASASGSKLIDMQVGGVSKFSVDKNGNISSNNIIVSGENNSILNNDAEYVSKNENYSSN
jgi:hypothetical protein